jgi:hypothetical protein
MDPFRRHVVLLSFDPIRALIMADRLLLIVPDGADSLLQTLKQYMAGSITFILLSLFPNEPDLMLP